jgi:hypothetical protein
MDGWYFAAGLAGGALLAGGAYLAYRFIRLRNFRASLGMDLFLVKIPRESAKEGERNFKTEINRFEQLISTLAALKRPVVFEVAVPHVGEEIHFFIAVPKRMASVAVEQIQGIWVGASVLPMHDDYNIFNSEGATACAYILQKENFALPLRTYSELESDSFGPILGSLSKVNEVGEGAALQVIMHPARPYWKKTVNRYLGFLKKGQPPEKVLGSSFGWSDMKEAMSGRVPDEKQNQPVDDDAVKALQSKIAKPLFEVNVRLVASGNSPFQAGQLLDGLVAGFEQFGAPRRNELKIVKTRNPQKISYDYIFRNFDSRNSMILSSEEIASLYHFPIASTETPRVKWLKSKEAPPPSDLQSDGTLVGISSYRGQEKEIHITDDDRRRHVYVIGQTGTGKSTAMGNMIIEDIRRGKGVALIDPHGELVQTVLGHIPKDRANDLIIFDPGDLWRPLGLNMLDYNHDRPEEKTFIVNEMQSIFNKLFTAETMGPMFEQYMRNALLLLMEDMPFEPATLIEVPRVFTDPEFRKKKLARIANPVVIDFWEKEAVKAGGEASLANMTPYITSKFNNFIANDYMRPIIGQAKSALNFREAMDQGKIILVNLSKGRIGDINANLLGMICTGKILMAALSRVDILDPKQRREFNLYIDEFQNFTTDSIASILSEARKYGLSLTMAHQFIAQLDEKIRDAVFGNVGSQIVFRVGVQDAEFLVKQFAPVFDESDLINIDNLNAYAKILIHGQTSKPFNMKIPTTSWAKGDQELAERMKEHSRVKYGADRDEVEKGIYARLRI